MSFTDYLSDASISSVIKLLKDLEADLDANNDDDASNRLSGESAAEIAHAAWITLDIILAKSLQGEGGYNYDQAPTDPRHGGKLTAEQASARIAELEAENTKLRAMLAKSNADCPYCGLPAAEMNRCAHGFPGCGRADDMLNESD